MSPTGRPKKQWDRVEGVRRYKAGENVMSICASLSVKPWALYNALAESGVALRGRKKAT